MMKKPRYILATMQDQSDVGINTFALQLMAEAHADRPEKFGDETLLLVGHAHNGKPVYMLISTKPPEEEQFKDWPVTEPPR